MFNLSDTFQLFIEHLVKLFDTVSHFQALISFNLQINKSMKATRVFSRLEFFLIVTKISTYLSDT